MNLQKKRAMLVICSWFEQIAQKKWVIHSKNLYFSKVFSCPMANPSYPSSLIHSILKSDLSDLLTSLFTKEWPWAIRSGRSWQKCDESDSFFFTWESLFRSFDHKKPVNRSKNQWGNSPLWIERTLSVNFVIKLQFQVFNFKGKLLPGTNVKFYTFQTHSIFYLCRN